MVFFYSYITQFPLFLYNKISEVEMLESQRYPLVHPGHTVQTRVNPELTRIIKNQLIHNQLQNSFASSENDTFLKTLISSHFSICMCRLWANISYSFPKYIFPLFKL